MNLGNKLHNLRKAEGMSQEQLAAQMTVSRQAVSKWELGESNPDIDYIIQLSEIFQVSTDYLLKDSETVPKDQSKGMDSGIWTTIIATMSAALMGIGLFCAWGGWHENQTINDVIGGLIIQIVGLAGYFICRGIGGRLSFGTTLLTTILGGFLPISLLTNLLFCRTAAPYPLDIRSGALFVVCYGLYVLIGFLLLKRSRAKSAKPS